MIIANRSPKPVSPRAAKGTIMSVFRLWTEDAEHPVCLDQMAVLPPERVMRLLTGLLAGYTNISGQKVVGVFQQSLLPRLFRLTPELSPALFVDRSVNYIECTEIPRRTFRRLKRLRKVRTWADSAAARYVSTPRGASQCVAAWQLTGRLSLARTSKRCK